MEHRPEPAPHVSVPVAESGDQAAHQARCADITYIRCSGVPEVGAAVDRLSRAVQSWELSNSLNTEFCMQMVEGAWSGSVHRGSSTPTKADAPRRRCSCRASAEDIPGAQAWAQGRFGSVDERSRSIGSKQVCRRKRCSGRFYSVLSASR